MRIEDLSGTFSEEEQQELYRFVTQDLLSSPEDIRLLNVIRIFEDPRDYLGKWGGVLRFNAEREVIEAALAIDLNSSWLTTLEAFKDVLAHEYGHHWTLVYHAWNRGINIHEEKLPRNYYELRGLHYENFYHNGARGWQRCDREVIAEDYRILFAPSPCNEGHDFESEEWFTPPSETVRFYIEDLANSPLL